MKFRHTLEAWSKNTGTQLRNKLNKSTLKNGVNNLMHLPKRLLINILNTRIRWVKSILTKPLKHLGGRLLWEDTDLLILRLISLTPSTNIQSAITGITHSKDISKNKRWEERRKQRKRKKPKKKQKRRSASTKIRKLSSSSDGTHI